MWFMLLSLWWIRITCRDWLRLFRLFRLFKLFFCSFKMFVFLFRLFHIVFVRFILFSLVLGICLVKYPRPVSCHVPRRPNTNSDPLLYTSYREYRLTTRSTHVATQVISHNDLAKAKANHTVPESSRESPCLSLSSPQTESNRPSPVPDAIERVATTLVLHQQHCIKLF